MARKRPRQLRDLLIQDAANLKRAGRLDSYVVKFFEGLRSYFRFHQVQFDGFPALTAIRGASLTNERIPTPEELRSVLERLSLRARVIALLMAHSGVRPGVLGSYGGENGLRLEDLPELSFEGGLKFSEVPFLIHVPALLSKTRRAYATFGTTQLSSALLAYLDERAKRGEALNEKSPIVAANPTRGIARKSRDEAKFSHGFLTSKAIAEELRGALKATVPKGVTWRPYVLRSYCSTRLLLAEGQGLISRDLREALLGHDGGIASRYNVGKRWGDELLAEARREYGRASSYLETGRPKEEADLLQQAKALLLEAVGVDAREVTSLSSRSKEEVLAEVRKRLGNASKGEVGPLPGAPNTTTDRLVTVADAERLLGAGWIWLGSVGDRVAIRGPA